MVMAWVAAMRLMLFSVSAGLNKMKFSVQIFAVWK